MTFNILKSSDSEDICVVVRSVGEASLNNCVNLILESGIPLANITVLNEKPFTTALIKSYSVGINSGRKWLVCVDADVLIDPSCLKSLYTYAESLPHSIFELKGFIYDKFYGGPKLGGIHWYRCSLLSKALEFVPSNMKATRPEAYTIRKMESLGYPWVIYKCVIGLHGYAQSYKDIYRTAYMHSKKHFHDLDYLYSRWSNNDDFDFKYAIKGFADGLIYSDSNSFNSGLIESSDMNFPVKECEVYTESEVTVIANAVPNFSYFAHFPFGVGLTSKTKSSLSFFKMCKSRLGFSSGFLFFISSILSFYFRLRNSR